VCVRLIFIHLCMKCSVCTQDMFSRLCDGICKPPGKRKPKPTCIQCACRFLFSEGPKRVRCAQKSWFHIRQKPRLQRYFQREALLATHISAQPLES
jgi:hypothetical protein